MTSKLSHSTSDPGLKVPPAADSIVKGQPLKDVLGRRAVTQLGRNLKISYKAFDEMSFSRHALRGLTPLSLTARADHIAAAMKAHLPDVYAGALDVIVGSFTPPLSRTENNGLAPLFYMPHASFIARYGLDRYYNDGRDPFPVSMLAQYELTRRFTAEFSIRPFIDTRPGRTFQKLYKWMKDPDPHVRRLCSEGPRPRLPWAMRLRNLVADPSPSIPILEKLKDDPELYVRRSVANHVGDIAKDHPAMALELCESWLEGAPAERKWVIRHALRHPAKKGLKKAMKIRTAAG